MTSRRQFLTSAGLLATGASTVSADSVEPVPAEEVGLTDEIADLLSKAKIDEARKLLNENDVRHSITKESAGSKTEGGTGGATPDSHYDESGADVYCTLVELTGNDRWLATGSVVHDASGSLSVREHSVVDDASALYWDNTKWTSPNPTSDNVTVYASGDHSAEFDQYDAMGTSAHVNLTSISTDSTWSVSHSTELLKDYTGSEVPVAYVFEHTFAYTSLGSLSISFGPLSITVNNGDTVWNQDAAAWPS